MTIVPIGYTSRMHAHASSDWTRWLALLMKQNGHTDLTIPYCPSVEGVSHAIVINDDKANSLRIVLCNSREEFMAQHETLHAEWLAETVKKNNGYTAEFSDAGDLFYLKEVADSHGFWMSTVATPGEPSPEQIKSAGGLTSPIYSIFRETDGSKSFRAVYSFAWWKIQSRNHRTEVLLPDDLRVKDYLETAANWKKR